MRLTACLSLLFVLAAPASACADGRIIVKYRKGASAVKRRSSVQAGDGTVGGVVRGKGPRVGAATGDAAGAAAPVARKPGVQWAEPDAKLLALGRPDDPLVAQLGGLGLMHAQAAWDALGLSQSWPVDDGVPVAV